MTPEAQIIFDLMLSQSRMDALKYMNESVYSTGGEP